MKKAFKAILCIALCSVFVLSLTACGNPSKKDILGKWASEVAPELDYITFAEDESGKIVCYRSLKNAVGVCRIKGNELICELDNIFFDDGDMIIQEFTEIFIWKDGKLVEKKGNTVYEKIN